MSEEIIGDLVEKLKALLDVQPSDSPVWSATDDEFHTIKQNAEGAVIQAEAYLVSHDDHEGMKYRRTTITAKGEVIVKEDTVPDDEVFQKVGKRGELGALSLINQWNIVAARGMRAGQSTTVYTVVS